MLLVLISCEKINPFALELIHEGFHASLHSTSVVLCEVTGGPQTVGMSALWQMNGVKCSHPRPGLSDLVSEDARLREMLLRWVGCGRTNDLSRTGGNVSPSKLQSNQGRKHKLSRGEFSLLFILLLFFYAAEYLFSAIFSLYIYGHNLSRTPKGN